MNLVMVMVYASIGLHVHTKMYGYGWQVYSEKTASYHSPPLRLFDSALWSWATGKLLTDHTHIDFIGFDAHFLLQLSWRTLNRRFGSLIPRRLDARINIAETVENDLHWCSCLYLTLFFPIFFISSTEAYSDQSEENILRCWKKRICVLWKKKYLRGWKKKSFALLDFFWVVGKKRIWQNMSHIPMS